MKQVESEQLLTDCRELLTNRMRSSMSRMMGDIEDTLFVMANDGKTADQSSHYIDAVREIRMKKREIQVRFENRFHDLFDQGVREGRKAGQSSAGRAVKVRQAGADMFAHSAERMRAECRSALVELDKHVSELLLHAADENFHNPMQPATILSAFQESCRDIQVGTDIRQLLADMFDKHMGTALQSVYGDLNILFQSYSAGSQAGSKSPNSEYATSPDNPDEADQSPRLTSLLVGNWVMDKIQLQLEHSEVPGFIREFLFSTWRLVLEKIYEKYGETAPEWDRAMQVVTDVIICAQLAADKDIRRQQTWLLPGLIYRLKAGMKTVAIPLKQQADFLSQLKSHHASITESSVTNGKPV